MPARAEADQLIRVGQIRPLLVILTSEPGQIHQHLLGSRFACERGNRHKRDWFPYSTGHGIAFQISLAYSAMVRSLENFPDAATFEIAMRAQASCWAYSST